MPKSKYKSKRTTEDGNTVYEYSDYQVKERNKAKAKKVRQLSDNIGDLRSKAKDDLKSDDRKESLTALIVLLLDETYARVGNRTSEEDLNHYGVTGWRKKHLTFRGNSVTISYVGKSGVDQTKKIENKKLVTKLKDLSKDLKDKDPLFTYECQGKTCRISASDVNSYLQDFDITAKDIRGYHANDLVRSALKKARKEGPDLRKKDDEEKSEALQKEFEKVLDEVAKELGHKPETLRNQYLIPGLEEHYLETGKVSADPNKKAMKIRRLAVAKKVASRKAFSLFSSHYDSVSKTKEVKPMKNLKNTLIRLGAKRPDLREHLRPIISSLETQSSEEDWDPAYKKLREKQKDEALRSVKKISRNSYVVSYKGEDIPVTHNPRQMEYAVKFPEGTVIVLISGTGARTTKDPARTGKTFDAGKIVKMVRLYKDQSHF